MTLDRDRVLRGGETTEPQPENVAIAPGHPGIPPTWTSSAKDMVGCSLGHARLWFTLGFGIVNEVYYPRVDIPQIRDLGFIIAGPDGFWSEVKRNQNYRLTLLAPGVPAVEITHQHPRYVLRLRITPDPRRDVLVVECRLDGDAGRDLPGAFDRPAHEVRGRGPDDRRAQGNEDPEALFHVGPGYIIRSPPLMSRAAPVM